MNDKLAVQSIDAHALIAQAIEKGVEPEALERLVALGERMLAIQAKQAYNEAMASFHRDCPAIYKTAIGQVGPAKTRYAPLDEIMEKVRPVLGANGLSASWRSPRTEPNHVVRVCRIAHALGHFEDSGEIVIPIGGQEDRSAATPAQRVGIAIAYADRYSVKDILGLAPEPGEDRDGASAGRPQSQPGQSQPGAETRSDPDIVISENQQKRLWAIAREAKWSQEEVHDLISGYQRNSTKGIKIGEYEDVIQKLKAGPAASLKKPAA